MSCLFTICHQKITWFIIYIINTPASCSSLHPKILIFLVLLRYISSITKHTNILILTVFNFFKRRHLYKDMLIPNKIDSWMHHYTPKHKTHRYNTTHTKYVYNQQLSMILYDQYPMEQQKENHPFLRLHRHGYLVLSVQVCKHMSHITCAMSECYCLVQMLANHWIRKSICQ